MALLGGDGTNAAGRASHRCFEGAELGDTGWAHGTLRLTPGVTDKGCTTNPRRAEARAETAEADKAQEAKNFSEACGPRRSERRSGKPLGDFCF